MKTVELICDFGETVYYFFGTKNKLTIAKGIMKHIVISEQNGPMYIVMDTQVVWSENEKYKKGNYLPSFDFYNRDMHKTVFKDKAEAKLKIKEMRKNRG